MKDSRKSLMSGVGISVLVLGLLFVIVALLALSASYRAGIARAENLDTKCSVETLRGSYGNSFQFLDTGPSSTPVPLGSAYTPGAGIGVVSFDGAGSYSGQQTINNGGQIFTFPVSGTYTVNSDCTGSRSLPGGGTLGFVIVERGAEVRELRTTPGGISSGVLQKQ